MNNLQNDGWDLRDLKFIIMNTAELARYRLEAGDLLFNRTNSKELVGKCDVFSEPGDWVFASYLIRVRVNTTKVLPQFASDFLNARSGRLQIDRLSRQIIGMTNINAEELKEIMLPVPPYLSIQQGLVDAMNTARAERQSKIADADALLAGLDGFILDALGLFPAFTDDRRVFAVRRSEVPTRFDPHFHLPALAQNLHMLDESKAKPLGSLVLFSGETWKSTEHQSPTFRYIEIGNVSPQTGEACAEEVLVAEAPSRARKAVRRNDIIVSLTRPHHGSIAQITPELDGCVASTGFAVLRSIEGSSLNREYLWSVLRSKICLMQMLQRASGGNYPAITEPELAKVLLPVPPPAVQESVATEARRRREEARRLRADADRTWQAAKRWFEDQLLEAV